MKNEPCSCLTCSGYCSCGLSGHHIQITDMEPEGFSQVTVTSNPPNQSRDSQIDSNDPKKKVLLFNHGKGGEIEVSMIEDILYKLRPRLYDRNETPRQRVEAVMEAKAALQKIIASEKQIVADCPHINRYSVDSLPPQISCKDCGVNLKDNRSSE